MRWPIRCTSLTAGLLCTGTAMGTPDRLVQVVPADPLAVWFSDQRAAEPDRDRAVTAARFAAALLHHSRHMGLMDGIDPTAGLVVDAVALLPELARYPRALVLLDVRADALGDGGFRLGGIAAGLVVVTGGDHARIAANLQSLLDRYANDLTGRLTQRAHDRTTVYTLTDNRLPPWAVIEWGPVRDCYLIAFGPGTLDRLASTVTGESPNLASDGWFAQAHGRGRGPRARWEWTVDLDALCRRLVPVMGDKPRRVTDALGLAEVSRALWTVGPPSRTIDAACVLRAAGRDRTIPITLTGEEVGRFASLIPPQAGSGAVIHARLPEMIPRACEAYLAARSPSVRDRLREHWAAIQRQADVQAERDILHRWGRHVIVHDFPRHPLGLPLLRTVLIELDGSADAVRAALDRLLEAAQAYVRRQTEEPSALSWLKRDADGVWYVQFGLLGPALAVTDQWIVISTSPQAVRQNVQWLDHAAAPTPSSGASLP